MWKSLLTSDTLEQSIKHEIIIRFLMYKKDMGMQN